MNGSLNLSNRERRFINEVLNKGLAEGIPVQDIFRAQTATTFEIKMYNYFEKFNMRVMALLLQKGILTKKEIVELFADAMRDAGEPEHHVQSQIVQLKRIYALG